jgi:CheY-like chemotaxis protein
MVDRIDDAVASLEALLKGLLDLSRLESGTVKPRLEHVALQPLFDAVAAHERALAQDQGLQLRWRPTRLAVQTDPVLLEQILRNLVSNGLRHSNHGGVLVAARARGDRVLLQVWDTGYGIAPEQQAEVFEEFVQLDNPARERARGLGLGLAIVKRCAHALGCKLLLRSRPGRGSCFSLELPAARALPAAAPAPSADQAPLAGWQFVVVEDDPAVREALQMRLAQWGAEVAVFDGVAGLRQALAAGELSGADLVVTDNRLAGGGAEEVVRMARLHLGGVRALVVTGDTSPDVIATLAASGLPVLHKPFRTEQLLAAIRAAAAMRAA